MFLTWPFFPSLAKSLYVCVISALKQKTEESNEGSQHYGQRPYGQKLTRYREKNVSINYIHV